VCWGMCSSCIELGVRLGNERCEVDAENVRNWLEGDNGGAEWDRPETGEVGDDGASVLLEVLTAGGGSVNFSPATSGCDGMPPPTSSPIAMFRFVPSLSFCLERTNRVPVPKVGNTAKFPIWS